MAKKKTPRRIIEGDVSNEKLKQLVEQDSESRTCEYKPGSPLKPNSYQQVRIVKTLVSFANVLGGWVVIGLGDKATEGRRRHPVIGLDKDFLKTHQIAEFDEQIKDKVSKYLEDSDEPEIKAEIHTWSSNEKEEVRLAIIHVNKSKMPILFKKDGKFGNNKFGFKMGQYYYRRGKRNFCAGSKKLAQVIEQKVNDGWAKKQGEFLGVKELVEQMKVSNQKQDEVLERFNDVAKHLSDIVGISRGPTQVSVRKKEKKIEEQLEVEVSKKAKVKFSEDKLFLSDTDFEDVLLDLLREESTFAFQGFLIAAQKYFIEKIPNLRNTSKDEEIYEVRDKYLGAVLDKLTNTGILLVHHDEIRNLEQLKTTFYDIFESPAFYEIPNISQSDRDFFSPSWIWGEVLKRIYVIGSYAVLGKRYKIVPLLVKQVIEWDSYWEKRYWARYTSVMFAREKRYKGTRGLCKIFSDYVLSNNYIFERFRSKEDKVVDLMCQFDFLQCLISIKKNKDLSDCYPSFGSFYSSRIRPMVLQLIDNKKIRQEIVDLSNRELAEYIFRLDELCGKEFFVQWDSLVDGEILDFIEKNYTPGQGDTISY